MIGGLVEIAESGRHVSVYRGFLKVSEDGNEIGRVPLDDITALILSGPQITLSKALLVELAERKAVIVTSGRNWHPVSLTLPFGAHFESAGVLRDQIDMSEPFRKRLWQQVVQDKIRNQASVLRYHAPDSGVVTELEVLGRRVKSGDPENMEAQAARRYWPALMGKDFRRDRNAEGTNAFLNYGYTVLRAATARAVCGSGLHPALGLHHGSRVNSFALVDDLMEPFRPMVDLVAMELSATSESVGVEEKRRLAAVLQTDMVAENGFSPVVNCIVRLAQSLTAALSERKPGLAIAAVREPGQLL
jgi:CRISPR-associated protein Cas1